MRFDCFYYPTLKGNEIIKSTDNIIEFKFGDKVPCKTLYYNYGDNFAIYQGDEFFIVENNILKRSISFDKLKYPLKIIFNKGTQMTIFSPKELTSIRLVLKGENENEKLLGELLYLSIELNRRIKNIQYKIMSELTNSSKDYNYINESLDLNTKDLLDKLKIVESLFYNLTIEYPKIKEDYLEYMNFGVKEDLNNVSIYKYFNHDTDEYKEYKLRSSVWKTKPIYPKFKLDHLLNSSNYNI